MPQLLTTIEAAARLGVEPWTLTRLARRGIIPTAQQLPGIRGARLFRAEDIDAHRNRAA